ncbi:hypothetical protein [Streptomyces olivaceoviridis]|uniref:hypothetical protein n=1 Tax=Streptomyces olivaceoviridis TaxID=1921 RepID=UPI0036B0E6B9
MRTGLVATAVLTAVTAVTVGAVAGCDDGPRPDLVVEGTPPATPYSGPLDVPTEELDESTPRALRLASGAAGRALECDGEIFQGSGPDGWSRSDGGDTPEEGLALYFDMVQPEEPDHGYRVEREEADRVLYSYDVDGRTKVAVVVAKDQKGRPGWGPETNASCDPAELPESFTSTTDWQIWTDRAGRRVPVARLHSSSGPEHCGWQSADFLALDGRTYARDPEGVLGRDELLRAPYRAEVRMPADARDTGYRFRDRRLWLTADRATAYVRTDHGVEAWPLVKEGVGCD